MTTKRERLKELKTQIAVSLFKSQQLPLGDIELEVFKEFYSRFPGLDDVHPCYLALFDVELSEPGRCRQFDKDESVQFEKYKSAVVSLAEDISSTPETVSGIIAGVAMRGVSPFGGDHE